MRGILSPQITQMPQMFDLLTHNSPAPLSNKFLWLLMSGFDLRHLRNLWLKKVGSAVTIHRVI